MTKSNFQSVTEFHEKYGLKYEGLPRELPKELKGFRARFLMEELEEYCTAVIEGDLEGQLDALVDLVYVALGTAQLQGFDFDEAFRRVHEANMKKIRTENKDDSKRGSSFDVIKPPGWQPPQLADICYPILKEKVFRTSEEINELCQERKQALAKAVRSEK